VRELCHLDTVCFAPLGERQLKGFAELVPVFLTVAVRTSGDPGALIAALFWNWWYDVKERRPGSA
jgi:hypothetical protein